MRARLLRLPDLVDCGGALLPRPSTDINTTRVCARCGTVYPCNAAPDSPRAVFNRENCGAAVYPTGVAP